MKKNFCVVGFGGMGGCAMVGQTMINVNRVLAGQKVLMLGSGNVGLIVSYQLMQAGADVVFVCLGAPRQEKWAAEHGPATGARLFAGLGGSLDVFAGRAKRAPALFQRLGLEWLYRLCREPARIGRMAKLPLILGQAAAARLRGR